MNAYTGLNNVIQNTFFIICTCINNSSSKYLIRLNYIFLIFLIAIYKLSIFFFIFYYKFSFSFLIDFSCTLNATPILRCKMSNLKIMLIGLQTELFSLFTFGFPSIKVVIDFITLSAAFQFLHRHYRHLYILRTQISTLTFFVQNIWHYV